MFLLLMKRYRGSISNGRDRNGMMGRLDSFIRHPCRWKGGHEVLTEGGSSAEGLDMLGEDCDLISVVLHVIPLVIG